MLFVVSSLSVLIDIQTLLLDASVATQAVGIFDGTEENHASHEGEQGHYNGTQGLYPNGSLHTIDAAVTEDTREDGTQQTTYTMYGHGTYGVIHMHFLVDETYGEAHHYRYDDTDEG